MSMTSGPTVPGSTGKVAEVDPSEKLRVAVRSFIVRPSVPDCGRVQHPGVSSYGALPAPSDRSQAVDQRADPRIGRLGAPGDEVPQGVVGQVQQCVELGDVVIGELRSLGVEKAREDEVVFE